MAAVTVCDVAATLAPFSTGYLSFVKVHKFPFFLSQTLPPCLTKCNGVFVEKMTVAELIKKYSAFYGNVCFNSVFMTARHRSLS
jgi:hypothetical protein